MASPQPWTASQPRIHFPIKAMPQIEAQLAEIQNQLVRGMNKFNYESWNYGYESLDESGQMKNELN